MPAARTTVLGLTLLVSAFVFLAAGCSTEKAPAPESATPPPAAKSAPPIKERAPEPATAEGNVINVRCDRRLETFTLDFTLDSGTFEVAFHSDDYRKIEFLRVGVQTPGNFNPCLHLDQYRVRVSYRVVSQQPFQSEILAIELRRR